MESIYHTAKCEEAKSTVIKKGSSQLVDGVMVTEMQDQLERELGKLETLKKMNQILEQQLASGYDTEQLTAIVQENNAIIQK